MWASGKATYRRSAARAAGGGSRAPFAGTLSLFTGLRTFTKRCAINAMCIVRSLALATGILLVLTSSNSAAQSSLPWHAIASPVVVSELSSLNVWLLGRKDGVQTTYDSQLVRVSLAVPQLVSFVQAMEKDKNTARLNMIATAPMSHAILVTGIRVTFETKTMRAGNVETPRLATPVRVPAGKAIFLVYNPVSGVFTLTPQQ